MDRTNTGHFFHRTEFIESELKSLHRPNIPFKEQGGPGHTACSGNRQIITQVLFSLWISQLFSPQRTEGAWEQLSQVSPLSTTLQASHVPGGKSPSPLHKALYGRPPPLPALISSLSPRPYLLPLSPSLTLLQPLRLPNCFSKTPNTVLPQGLCTGCSLC